MSEFPVPTGPGEPATSPGAALRNSLSVLEVGRERAGDRGQDGRAGGDQPEFAVAAQRRGEEVLGADERPRVCGAVVGLDHLPVDVEAGRGAEVADLDPGRGQ